MTNQERLRFQEAELSYVENTVGLSDLEQVVAELAKDFNYVRITRRWAGPMATPLFGDVAITLILGIPAAAILSELGKDLYSGLRSGLFALYRSAKLWANSRGYAPFAVVRESEKEHSEYQFTFHKDLSQREFEDAILLIPRAIASYGETRGPTGFVYKDGQWELDQESQP